MDGVGKKSPALVELVLVILFCSLFAMILIQIFVKARVMSETGSSRTLGVLLAQDIIEQWKADPKAREEIFPEEAGWIYETPTRFCSYRDKDMSIVPEEEAVYTARVFFSEETQEAGALYRIQVTLTRIRNDVMVAELKTAGYVPEEVLP